MARRAWWSRTVQLTATRKQTGSNRKEPGKKYITPKKTPTVSGFLQSSPTIYSPTTSQKSIQNLNGSINGISRSLDQSPHDLIFSENTLTDPLRGVLY
jgi:hypothetical protein